jgi:hypothetical protein
MGGRIEIPLEEYNSFQTVKTNLENTINSLSKENAMLKEKYEALSAILLDVKESTISERVFKWDTLWKPIMHEIDKYEKR